jgi:branched-subunit amino acid transport protein
MHTFAELWPVLLGMTLVTYFTRVGGLWIVGLAKETPRLSRTLQHLATGVLTALVVSGLREGDSALIVAAVAAIRLMRVTGQFLTAIGGAALTAALVRAGIAFAAGL